MSAKRPLDTFSSSYQKDMPNISIMHEKNVMEGYLNRFNNARNLGDIITVLKEIRDQILQHQKNGLHFNQLLSLVSHAEGKPWIWTSSIGTILLLKCLVPYVKKDNINKENNYQNNQSFESNTRDINMTTYAYPEIPFNVLKPFLVNFNNFSSACKNDIIRYLISMYSYFSTETIKKLQALYTLFFQSLRYETLRKTLVVFLYKLTEPNHIREFRIRFIEALIAQSKDSGQSHRLLSIFLKYLHSLKTQLYKQDQASKTEKDLQKSLKMIPSCYWSNAMKLIHGSYALKNTKDEYVEIDESIASVYNISKKRKIDRNSLSISSRCLGSSKLVDHSLFLTFDHSQANQANYLLEWSGYSQNQHSNFSLPLDYLHPTVEEYLFSMIRIWDGVNNSSAIFTLFSRLRPRPFELLYQTCLLPIYRLFCSSSPKFKARVIEACTCLLKNVGSNYNSREMNSELDKSTYVQFVSDLIIFVDRLCVLGLLQEKDHCLVQHISMSFFELVASINIKFNLPLVAPPSKHLVYRALLSSSGMAVSQMSGILYMYKAAFEKLKDSLMEVSDSDNLYRGLDKISLFNKYLYDFSNSLWKNNILPEEGKENQSLSQLTHIPKNSLNLLRQTCSNTVNSSLSLTDSMAFMGFSHRFLSREDSMHEIKGSNRIEYLNFLKNYNMKGLDDFLFTFMNSLMNWKKRNERKSIEMSQ